MEGMEHEHLTGLFAYELEASFHGLRLKWWQRDVVYTYVLTNSIHAF
jgi:hypothetical protein